MQRRQTSIGAINNIIIDVADDRYVIEGVCVCVCACVCERERERGREGTKCGKEYTVYDRSRHIGVPWTLCLTYSAVCTRWPPKKKATTELPPSYHRFAIRHSMRDLICDVNHCELQYSCEAAIWVK